MSADSQLSRQKRGEKVELKKQLTIAVIFPVAVLIFSFRVTSKNNYGFPQHSRLMRVALECHLSRIPHTFVRRYIWELGLEIIS